MLDRPQCTNCVVLQGVPEIREEFRAGDAFISVLDGRTSHDTMGQRHLNGLASSFPDGRISNGEKS